MKHQSCRERREEIRTVQRRNTDAAARLQPNITPGARRVTMDKPPMLERLAARYAMRARK